MTKENTPRPWSALFQDLKPNVNTRIKSAIAELLPADSGLSLEKFCAYMVKYLSESRALFDGTPNAEKPKPPASFSTVSQFVLDCARYGLLPGGANPECYFNTFSSKQPPKMNVSYHGLKTLLYRSGIVKDIVVGVVHKEDIFECDVGDFLKPITHKISVERSGNNLAAFYAMFRLNDNSLRAEVLSIAEARNLQTKLGGKEDSPWKKNLESMAHKTLIRRLARHMNKTGDHALSRFLSEEIFEDDEASNSPPRTVATFVNSSEARPAALDFLDELEKKGELPFIKPNPLPPLQLEKEGEFKPILTMPTVPDFAGQGPMIEDRL